MSALLDSFATAFDGLAQREAADLGAHRRKALDAALRDGMPGPRSEAWKYTSLRALERRAFASPAPREIDADALDAALADVPFPRMVFVDGRHDAARSNVSAIVMPGIEVQPLSQVLREGEPRDANFLARIFAGADEVFANLNAALAEEGAVIRLDRECGDVFPLHLVFVASGRQPDAAVHMRHFIDMRMHSMLTVVEHHLALGEHRGLSNHVFHMHVGEGARLAHVRVQGEAAGATLIARSDAVLARRAHYDRLDLELGAALSRHELNVRLEGGLARLAASGVLFADGKRHVDTRLGIDHIARDTACDLFWRGLATDRGRAAFHGGIVIREGADGSNANLSNKNLLLSSQAEIDTQPVLVIHADEVQAAHGATVGQLDPTALFYLRTRGLPETEARALLTTAFCREALNIVAAGPMRDALTAMLDARLAGATGP
ncbi:MAG: Fe-S cluster assembly protein SufD [Lysobacter sp.]|nr:Fe-S cluster assembly protein SufD [Lysobacter sp.]